MRNRDQTLTAIEYAFMVSLIASFSVLTVAGLIFGFQFGHWAEWQGILVGVTATIAGIVGAVFGLRLASDSTMKAKTPR
jgi:hypothetical protein